MTPSTAQPAIVRSSRRVEKNLRLLHRRGLPDPRLDDLKELVAVARNLSSEPTDREMVENALAQAIDACWGGAREAGPSLRDVVLLWFGLPAVDDSAAPNTRALSSSERLTVAWTYWGGKDRETKETFRTSKAAKRYEALAKKLVELEVAAIRSATTLDTSAQQSVQTIPEPGQPPTSAQHESTSPITTAETRSPEPFRLSDFASVVTRLRPKRQIAALLTAAAVAGIVIWAPWSSSHNASIPPLGAIVNAQTGIWSMDVPMTPAESPTGVGEGGGRFRGCDVSTEHPCRYKANTPPLKVNVGDTLEFSAILNNGYDTAIPYVKLEAFANQISHSSGPSIEPRHARISTELVVGMNISWPSVGELGAGPITTHHTQTNDIYIQLPTPRNYGLSYIPGTSTIHFSEPYFFHNLPDGIMESGIALQDVGQPKGCFRCDAEYRRLVSFRAKVIVRNR